MTGPGTREVAVVEPVHRVDVACRRREERLGDRSKTFDRDRLLAPVDELEHQFPRDAGEAARVEPGRHQRAVEDDEHVRASALAQLAAGVGEEGLAAAPLPRPRQGDDVLGIARRLQSGDRRALVADPRAEGDGSGRLPLRGGPGEHGERRTAVAPPGAERGAAGGDGDPETADLGTVRLDDGRARLPDEIVGGGVDAEAGARAPQAAKVSGEGERCAPDHLQRLEAPVAGRQAVVVERARRAPRCRRADP